MVKYNKLIDRDIANIFKMGGGWGFKITKSCLVSDKYLKIDSVKDRGVRGEGVLEPLDTPSGYSPDVICAVLALTICNQVVVYFQP